jgi:hypothetical protein
MTQIYCAYLGKFVKESAEISGELIDVLGEATLFDWQRMWIIAALMQATSADDQAVKAVVPILTDPARHDALRAVAAMFVGKFEVAPVVRTVWRPG